MIKCDIVLTMYDGIKADTFFSLMRAEKHAHDNGIQLGYGGGVGDTIDRARSAHASKFLEHPEDHEIMMFIDHDMIFEPDALYKVIEGCHDTRAVVGAAYPARQGKHGIPIVANYFGEKVKFGPTQPLLKVRGLPTGFMAIHRDVLLKLAETMPICYHQDMKKFYPFFCPVIGTDFYDDKVTTYFSEDLSFCWKCNHQNIDIWLDPSVLVTHIAVQRMSILDIEGLIK